MLYSWRFSRYSVPIHWLVHGHMTSNNETVSRQMPCVGNIAKTMTSNGKLACSAGVFVLELAVVSSPPYWLEQSRFQPNSHSLGRIFVSLQASSEFESQDGARLIKLAASLAKIRLHCRLLQSAYI